jgi:hypothetical protein
MSNVLTPLGEGITKADYLRLKGQFPEATDSEIGWKRQSELNEEFLGQTHTPVPSPLAGAATNRPRASTGKSSADPSAAKPPRRGARKDGDKENTDPNGAPAGAETTTRTGSVVGVDGLSLRYERAGGTTQSGGRTWAAKDLRELAEAAQSLGNTPGNKAAKDALMIHNYLTSFSEREDLRKLADLYLGLEVVVSKSFTKTVVCGFVQTNHRSD